MSTPSKPFTSERRLELLREIRDGGYTLRAGPSAEAQAVLAVKLAEWRELDKLQDIRLRTIPETTPAGEELAVAILTPLGRRFLAEREGESGEPTEQGLRGCGPIIRVHRSYPFNDPDWLFEKIRVE
jgi:hypothetical protein